MSIWAVGVTGVHILLLRIVICVRGGHLVVESGHGWKIDGFGGFGLVVWNGRQIEEKLLCEGSQSGLRFRGEGDSDLYSASTTVLTTLLITDGPSGQGGGYVHRPTLCVVCIHMPKQV